MNDQNISRKQMQGAKGARHHTPNGSLLHSSILMALRNCQFFRRWDALLCFCRQHLVVIWSRRPGYIFTHECELGSDVATRMKVVVEQRLKPARRSRSSRYEVVARLTSHLNVARQATRSRSVFGIWWRRTRLNGRRTGGGPVTRRRGRFRFSRRWMARLSWLPSFVN